MRTILRAAGLVVITLLGALAATSVVRAQSGAPAATFDVVSIRPAAPDGKPRVEVRGDRFVATAITLRDLLKLAYPVNDLVRNDDQIAGAPSWARTTRFDIVATARPGSPPVETTPGAIAPRPNAALREARAKLQALLADRFGLRVHHEDRELPVYVLRRAERTAAQLHQADDCTPDRTPPADPGTAPCGGFSLAVPYQLSGHAVTMGMFVSLLANLPILGRAVEDQTGLSGRFDLVLRYSRELPGTPPATTAPDAPSIFTALQEQLGLRLDSTRRPVDVVVIDKAHTPTPN